MCTSGEGRSLLLQELDTVRPAPLGVWQVQGFGVFFVNFIRDIGQDITPYDPTRCPLLTGMTLAFCLRATVDKYLLLPCGLLGQLSRGTEPLIADYHWINNWDHLHPRQYHREVIPWGDVHSYGCWDQFELDKYIFKRWFVIQPISEAGFLFLVLIVLKTWTLGWPIHVQNNSLAFPPSLYAKRSKINLCEPTSSFIHNIWITYFPEATRILTAHQWNYFNSTLLCFSMLYLLGC